MALAHNTGMPFFPMRTLLDEKALVNTSNGMKLEHAAVGYVRYYKVSTHHMGSQHDLFTGLLSRLSCYDIAHPIH